MSRHCSRALIIVSCSVSVSSSLPQAGAAEFRSVVSGSTYGIPIFGDLSDNGRVIVGGSWRWSVEGGLESIPPPVPLEPGWSGPLALAVSADGSKTYLSSQIDLHHVWALPVRDIAPFVYENGVFAQWERLHDESYPYCVVPDGSIAVGWDFEFESQWLAWEESTYRAAIWINGVVWKLDELPAGPCGTGDDDQAMAMAISDDGTIIVGNSGERGEHVRPIVWINGVVSRLDPFGPTCGISTARAFYSEFIDGDDPYPVRDLSGDGRFAVGVWTAGIQASDALYWPIDTRIAHLLPKLHPNHTRAAAACITRTGDRIGGFSGKAYPAEADVHGVIWDRVTGLPQDVADVLRSVGLGADIAGWKLTSVEDISANGMQIAGLGVQPDGRNAIWWADLTNPPKNDACAHAATLVTNTSPYVMDTQTHSVNGTTREGTWDGGASCASTAHENTNIWYKFTAPVDGYLMLDLCNSPLGLLDEYLSVHTGCPGTAGNEILCITGCPHRRECDWPCVEPPELVIPAGQTRYIQVGGWSDEGHDTVLAYRFLPLNDDCADAFSVGHNPSSTPGSTENMTADTGADCQSVSATAPGVWYTVLGTGTTMTASTCGEGGDANFDTQISVFCSGCSGQTCVAANDDGEECAGASFRHSAVSWCSSPGSLYHILVHGYGGETGIYELAVRDDGQSCPFSINCHPPNEACEQAISVSSGTMMSDNTGASTSAPAASCAATTNSVWFHYRTRCDGQLWVDTCQLGVGSVNDSVVSFYDGCSGAELACNDDYRDSTINCQHRSAAIGTVSQGQDILIRVAGYGALQLNQGTFPLRVTEVAAPLQIPSSTMPDGYLGAAYTHLLGAYGSCGRRFTTATGLPPGLSLDLFTGLVSGIPLSAGDFAIHVDVCNNDVLEPECAAADLTLRVWPTNDACADAVAITEGLRYFGNAGATTDGPNEPVLCTDGSGDAQVGSDVWYRYTSSCDGRATIDLCASDYDTKLAVYPGPSCPAGEGALACNDDACAVHSSLNVPVALGAEYLIRIGGYHAQQGTGRMLLTCMNDCNGNLVSDAEELAIGGDSDCNLNTRPDSCDVRGDYNADASLNLLDWPVWLGCLWGPCGQGICSPRVYAEPCCAWIDFAGDGDVDLQDFSALQRRDGQ